MAGMNEVYTGISDFHRRGPYAAHVTAYRSAGDAPISLLTSAKPAGTYTFPPTIDLILGLAIRGVHQAEYDFGAGRWRGRTLPGNFALLAPGVGASVTSTNVGECLTSAETLLLAVPAAALQPTLAGVRAGASWADFGRLHAAPFRDPFLETLCRQFWDEAVEGNPHGRLFADGALLVLASALLRLARNTSGAPHRARALPRLSSAKLRRVCDLVNEHMDKDLSLADLASAAGLSPSHFLAAFRVSVGESPYRHLAIRRIERAKELLATTGLPISEIGLMVGYANQAHFTTACKRLTGTTPGAYRRTRQR